MPRSGVRTSARPTPLRHPVPRRPAKRSLPRSVRHPLSPSPATTVRDRRRAGMDDDHRPPLPNRFRDIGFQKRADDEIKISRRRRGQHCVASATTAVRTWCPASRRTRPARCERPLSEVTRRSTLNGGAEVVRGRERRNSAAVAARRRPLPVVSARSFVVAPALEIATEVVSAADLGIGLTSGVETMDSCSHARVSAAQTELPPEQDRRTDRLIEVFRDFIPTVGLFQ